MLSIQQLYKIIYNPKVNFVLRNLNFAINLPLKTGVKLPPSGVLRLPTDSGLIKINTNQTSYLTQLLFWNGYKNFEYSSIFEKLSKECSVFFDIGANIGYYSLLASKSNPEITVFAFEPAKGPQHYLKKNVGLNHMEKNIRIIDLALSNTSGIIDFFEVANDKYQALDYNLSGEGNAGTKKVSRNFTSHQKKATTLEAFVEMNNIKQLDLIKIDTEGTEIDILKSGEKVIKQFRPLIICETLYDTIEDELEKYFQGIDYNFYNHTNHGLQKVDTIQREEDNGIRNCFFVPKEKAHQITKYLIT